MARTNFKELLEAGVHFGHLKKKWNPGMNPYVFMERNGIHIIDLNKTVSMLDEAAAAMKQIARSGKIILFVAIFFLAIFLLDKIKMPTPNKLIKQEISNDKLITVK